VAISLSEITFFMYVQSWNIEKPNNLSNFGSNKTKDHKTGQPKSAKVTNA